MTDQELKNLLASYAADNAKAQADNAKAQAENAAGFAALRATQAKSEAKLDKLSAMYGGISENLGAAAEEFFYNSLKETPIVGGIRYDDIRQHTGVGNPKNWAEIDLWLENGSSIAVVEVKHRVHPSAIDQLERQLTRVREFCPEYKDYKLYGGIAGMSIPDEVVAQAKARGLFVLKCKGDVLDSDVGAMRAF